MPAAVALPATLACAAACLKLEKQWHWRCASALREACWLAALAGAAAWRRVGGLPEEIQLKLACTANALSENERAHGVCGGVLRGGEVTAAAMAALARQNSAATWRIFGGVAGAAAARIVTRGAAAAQASCGAHQSSPRLA